MYELEKGITPNGGSEAGKTWNILGQIYLPKATGVSTFAFEANTLPGQFVPVSASTIDRVLGPQRVPTLSGSLARFARRHTSVT